MKSSFFPGMIRTLWIGGLIGAVTLAAADKKKPEPPPEISRLSWMVGMWRMEKNSRVIDEQWMAQGGGLMLGMARTIVKGRLTGHEFLQIREGPSGALFFVAQPSGQKEAAYQLSSITGNSVAFENQQHDFPQKISYALQADGSIVAAIEGPEADGTVKRIEYAYRRVGP